MYLRNPGPVREYLTPGVEVVSVDPDCVYNVDEDDEELLTDSEDEEDDSNVTDSSDEDFIIDVEGLGQRRTTPKRQAAAEPISAATSIATFCPAATTTALPTNQTCLGKLPPCHLSLLLWYLYIIYIYHITPPYHLGSALPNTQTIWATLSHKSTIATLRPTQPKDRRTTTNACSRHVVALHTHTHTAHITFAHTHTRMGCSLIKIYIIEIVTHQTHTLLHDLTTCARGG